MHISAHLFALVALLDTTLAQATCPSLQLFAVRGTNEGAAWPGIFGDAQGLSGFVTSRVLEKVPNSATTGVKYPANFDFANSETQGIGNLTANLTSFSQACPNSKIAIIGYSQGAEVVSDTLCGREAFGYLPAIDTQYTKNIVAAIALSDPTMARKMTGAYYFGNSTGQGPFARTKLDACAAYTGRFAYWCMADDTVCDGKGGVANHYTEPATYQFEMSDWIAEQYYKAVGQTNPTPISLTSPLPYATGTKAQSTTARATTSKATTSKATTATPPYLNTTLTTRTLSTTSKPVVITSTAVTRTATATTTKAPTATPTPTNPTKKPYCFLDLQCTFFQGGGKCVKDKANPIFFGLVGLCVK